MGAGERSNSKPCEPSNSKPCEPSTSSQAAGGAWAKLVPADSAYPEVEVAEDDAVVCSLVAPAGGEELAWCEIRRGGDASSATIRNLSSDAIIVDGRIIQEEAVDIKPGSEIVPGPQKEGYLVYTFDITAAKDHDENNIKIVLDVENAKCSICLNLWHDVVTVAPCFHNFCNGCFSEWLRRSSTNSRDKSQSAACPQCKTAVQSVGRNHFLHNIEEAILQAFSSLQRSDEEIALLESYASVKSNLMELIPISKATWDAFGNRAFCQICAEEVGAGNRPLGCLNTRGYKNLQQKFFERTGKKHDKKQLKNKWETLKKEYNLWNDLKQKATGLGWDHKKGTISASDAWWKEHKQYPKHFRDGPPENLDDMDRMFDKAHVTGNTSVIPGEPSQEDQTVVDIDCAEDGEEDAAADGENIEVVCTQPKVVAKRRANNINPSPKKNKKNPIARDFKRMVDILAKGPVQSGPSIADAMDVAIQAGVVPGSDEHFIATRLFTKLENREVFVTMKTDEVKMNWLRRMFDLKMKKD